MRKRSVRRVCAYLCAYSSYNGLYVQVSTRGDESSAVHVYRRMLHYYKYEMGTISTPTGVRRLYWCDAGIS